jgi:SAM-dependent methyltransferase
MLASARMPRRPALGRLFERGRIAGRRLIPPEGRRRAKARFKPVWPPIGWARFGALRRLAPVSRDFGFDRGLPVDRYYIEDFLRRHGGANEYGAGDIRGRVLEVGDDIYTKRWGSGIERVDVLHVDDTNPRATIVGDLTRGDGIPSDVFDCVICAQTLHVIYDMRAALATLYRALAPGGVLLATFPGLTQTCRPDRDLWGDYWRFTSLSARLVFEEAFPADCVRVEAYGNVLAATAFLQGLASEELRKEELEARDPDYEVLIAVRAQKLRGPEGRRRPADRTGAISRSEST